jgi:antitoxin YefM
MFEGVPKEQKSKLGAVDEECDTLSDTVPTELCHEIESEIETAYLLKSDNMKQRLSEAKNREEGISLDEACQMLGI